MPNDLMEGELKRAAMWNNVGYHDSDIDQAVSHYLGQQRQAEAQEYSATLNYLAHQRAEGGPVEKGRPYLVGEKGPEVIVPETNGTVVPNKALNLSDVAPAGKWEDLGGGLQATSGPGTYMRPAARQVAPKPLDLSSLAPGAKVAMESGQFVQQPIHVIRGLRSSYAGGPAGQEWLSLDRAARAGRGEYMPTIAEEQHRNRLEEIAASGKSQQVALGQNQLAQKQATDYLNQVLLEGHGVADPTDKTGQNRVLPDYARKVALQALPHIKTLEDVPKILERLGPELKTAKEMDLFNNQVSRDASRTEILTNYRQQARAADRSPDPGTENYIKTTPVTKDNLFWFKQFQAPRTSSTQVPSLKATATGRSNAPGTRMTLAEHDKYPHPTFTHFRAEGGPVEQGQAYVVGEKGPEAVVPDLSSLAQNLSNSAPIQQSQHDEVSLGGKG